MMSLGHMAYPVLVITGVVMNSVHKIWSEMFLGPFMVSCSILLVFCDLTKKNVERTLMPLNFGAFTLVYVVMS